MKVQEAGLMYATALGAPMKPTTPPPTVDGPKYMVATALPTIDPLPTRSFANYAHLCLGRDDMTGCTIVVYGGDIGVYSRRVRVFSLYGSTAPQLELIPLNLTGKQVEVSPQPMSAMPHESVAFLLVARSTPDTKPGKYRTNIEVEGEGTVDYLSVVIDVADLQLNKTERVTTDRVGTPLEILFSAAKAGAFAMPRAEGYAALMAEAAYANHRLFNTLASIDPLLTEALTSSLQAVTTHIEDDALLLQKVRQTLLYRADDRFEIGNREPLPKKEGK